MLHHDYSSRSAKVDRLRDQVRTDVHIDLFKYNSIALYFYLIFFAFSLIVSSFTKIPFPLYGSGFLHSLISAAK